MLKTAIISTIKTVTVPEGKYWVITNRDYRGSTFIQLNGQSQSSALNELAVGNNLYVISGTELSMNGTSRDTTITYFEFDNN